MAKIYSINSFHVATGETIVDKDSNEKRKLAYELIVLNIFDIKSSIFALA